MRGYVGANPIAGTNLKEYVLIKKFILCSMLTVGSYNKMEAEDKFVARVIFSEASPICNNKERYYVASVIKNRVGHIGFQRGKLSTMNDVVNQNRAFSCIDDRKNSNWEQIGILSSIFPSSEPTLPAAKKTWKIWNHCCKLSKGNFRPFKDIVYYHDKSISKPASWDNRWWKAIKVLESKHFIFYKVEETI